jgi:hypothetical protein
MFTQSVSYLWAILKALDGKSSGRALRDLGAAAADPRVGIRFRGLPLGPTLICLCMLQGQLILIVSVGTVQLYFRERGGFIIVDRTGFFNKLVLKPNS